MIKVGTISATTTENSTIIDSDIMSTLILTVDSDCMISINNNKNYQLYKANEIIPLQDRKGKFEKLFHKTITGTANIRFWVM